MITAEDLRKYTNHEVIKEMDDDHLEGAIMLAVARLKSFLCDPALDYITPVPLELKLAVSKVAEFYAFGASEEDRTLKGMKSESMGDYSYTRADSKAIISSIMVDLGPLLTEFNLCEVRPSKNMMKMRRL